MTSISGISDAMSRPGTPAVAPLGRHQGLLRQALRRRRAQIGLIAVAVPVAIAIIGPLFAPHSATGFVGAPFSGASGLELASLNGGLIQFLQNGSTNNTLSLQIDLTTLPQLPAGTYTGILNIAAQAM